MLNKVFISVIFLIIGIVFSYFGWIPAIYFNNYFIWLYLYIIGMILANIGCMKLYVFKNEVNLNFNPVDW